MLTPCSGKVSFKKVKRLFFDDRQKTNDLLVACVYFALLLEVLANIGGSSK